MRQEICTHDRCVCMGVGAFASGLLPRLRKRAKLMVFQAWFDDSGKERNQGPVYLLAGYVARVRVWEAFAHDWQDELDREPKLDYLHTKEAYHFTGQFGHGSQWEQNWGPRNFAERDARLLRFAEIIRNNLKPLWQPYMSPDRMGVTWMLKHDEYAQFVKAMEQHPRATPKELRMIKNPYYLSFQYMLGTVLKYKGFMRTDERIEILFDEGVDRRDSLEIAFNSFVEVVLHSSPDLLKLLINKQAEFRDDKDHPELQAADVLAWHLRRFVFEIAKGNRAYQETAIWKTLRSSDIQYLDLRYDERRWKELVGRLMP